MKKILLTSTGLTNINIKNKFMELLDKDIASVKVLFIITAANDPDAVRILSGCLDDLTECGIPDDNITIYDMHKLISQEQLEQYDAIYVCGGSTKYLVERCVELNFKPILHNYIANGGIYLGVSAGSVACSGTYEMGLDLIKNKLDVHCSVGTPNGIIQSNDEVYLTDNQAIYINDSESIIFE